MYVVPKISDFGRIEVHTYSLSGSAPEVDETTATGTGGGGGGGGIGLVGLLGGAAVLAGRGSSTEVVAGADEEEEKQAPK
jgi:hypothetical protein